jgi:hypothetical protein
MPPFRILHRIGGSSAMKQRRSNISAALAIAVERRVDEIIAIAKGKCALHSQLSVRRASARAFAEQEIVRQLQTRRGDGAVQRRRETRRDYRVSKSRGANGQVGRRVHRASSKRVCIQGFILSLFGLRRCGGVAADSDIASGHTQFQSLRSIGVSVRLRDLYRRCLTSDPNVAALSFLYPSSRA